LGGTNITLLGFPIKQTDTQFQTDPNLFLQGVGFGAIDNSAIRSTDGRTKDSVITAVHILRKRQSEEHRVFEAIIERELENTVNQIIETRTIPSVTPDDLILHGFFTAAAGPLSNITSQPNAAGKFKFGSNLGDNPGFTQFSIHLTDKFILFMRGNSFLDQGVNNAVPSNSDTSSDYKTVAPITTLKRFDGTIANDDVISIEGTNNRIIVLTQFIVDGQLVFDDNSELIFEFDDRLSDQLTGIDCTTGNPFGIPQNPVVFINSNINLPASSRLVFRGNGTVVFGDNVIITFSNLAAPIQDPLASPNLIILQRPTLLFTDGAMAQLAAGATFTLQGQGKVVVDDGAMFVIDGGQQVTVGTGAANNTTGLPDNIDWIIERNGKVDVTSTNSDQAILFFQLGQYGMSIKQEGQLHIGSNGLVAFGSFVDQNVNPRVAQGYLKKFEAICCGKIIIESACGTPGKLQFTPNILSNPSDPKTEKTTYLNIGSCDLRGRGTVCFVGLPESGNFCGTFQPDTFAANACIKTTCRNACQIPMNIVSCFINKNPSLCFASVFDTTVNGNAVQEVLFRNGTISKPLLPGDIITGEDPLTGNVFGINNGRLFVLHPGCINGGEIRE
jgi:hypothetical protein